MRNPERIKIGVIGVGHHGIKHLKILREIPEFDVYGFYDLREEKRQRISYEFNIRAYDEPEALIRDVDAVDIVSPATTHEFYIDMAFQMRKHIFVEKPPFTSVSGIANHLLKIANENGNLPIVFRTGMVEKFNPAYRSALPYIEGSEPYMVESVRRSPFPGRCLDVSVVFDVALHDIDIFATLWLKNNTISEIHGFIIPVMSPNGDTIDAILRTSNGTVFHIMASRVSITYERRMVIRTPASTIEINFFERTCTILDNSNGKNLVIKNEGEGANPLKEELENFARDILNNNTDDTHLRHAIAAIEICLALETKCQRIKTSNLEK